MSRSNVQIMPGQGKRPPDAILEAAKNGDLKDVVIVGWGKDGEFFMSSSCDRVREMQWLLANATDELWAYMRRENAGDWG